MNPIRTCAVFLSMSASLTFAAPAQYAFLDHSASTLMDEATAEVLWHERLSAKLVKLYPVKKWGFVSQVDGGFDDAKVCVITARAMMLPRSGKAMLYRPAKTATAFGTLAGASAQECKAFARTKLSEAIAAVASALMAQ